MDSKSRSRALRRELEGCFFRGNLPALIVSVVCMLLLTGVNLVTAWLMQRLVDVVVSSGSGLGSILLDLMQLEMEKRGIYHMYFVSTDAPGRRFYERHGITVFRTFTDYRKNLD